MALSSHIDSYYTATAIGIPDCPALAGEVEADICIVGAGYTGLSAALNLAERGYSVAVLEAERIGWGASGRNGGQIGTGYSPGMAKIEDWVGRDDARKLWDLAEEAKSIIRERVQRHGISCDLKPGYFHGAAKARDLEHLRDEVEHLSTRYGYRDARLIEPAEVGQYVSTSAYHGGLFDAGVGHLHPLNYCLGLARAAIDTGARIYENSSVVTIEKGSRPVARTAQGSVRAHFLVLAGNAYLGELVPSIRRKVMPVGTYMAATAPMGEDRARSLIPSDAAVTDTKFVLDYYRLSADHRLLFGGRVSYTTLPPPNLKAAMRRSMRAVLPQTDDLDLEYIWGGNVAITVERTPHLGRLDGTDNIYFAHGFSGMGVALTGIAGKVIAEAIAGTAERFDVFTRLPHTSFFGGKLLRTPTLALAMLWFRLRDWL
ncbi:MAG TPA: FAD-binding oxidoreductase [Verrucomicrobiae bacterium]|nr:FAD-binding oxidoreductase [Verrucomicrobiae bacterium]